MLGLDLSQISENVPIFIENNLDINGHVVQTYVVQGSTVQNNPQDQFVFTNENFYTKKTNV